MKTNDLKNLVAEALENVPVNLSFDELVTYLNEQGIEITDEEVFELSAELEELQVYVDSCGVLD